MRRTALLAAVIVAASAILSYRAIYEPDLWWHLAQGRENAAGHLLRTNVFSFTFPDYRQQFTSWLFDTIAYFAWTAVGGAGVQTLQLVLIASALLLLAVACRTRAPAWSAAAVLFVGFFIVEPRAIPRPHLVSFAGMAVCTLLIERAAARRSPKALIPAIPIVALWSNLHVECVFGVLLIALFGAAEILAPSALTRRDAVRALAVAAACGVATMANPYGWGLIEYLYENLSVPQMMAIAELRPAYLPDYRAFYVYLGLVAAALMIGLLQRFGWFPAARVSPAFGLWELSVAVVFATMGAMHLRLTPLILFTTAPIVAARLAVLATRGIDPRAIVITSFVAAVAVSRIPIRLLATGGAIGTEAVEPRQFFSRDAVAFITRTGLEGPVFNSHNLGGYLAWTLYPELRTFQDSRLQAYPPEHFRAIIEASASQPAWDALVADVEWAVLSVPRPNQLSGAGRFPIGEWATVFRDEAMEIVVRRSGRYGHLADGR